MDAMKYVEMIQDRHLYDLRKMKYKYSEEAVREMLQVMGTGCLKELSLTDFSGENHLVFAPALLPPEAEAIRSLLSYHGTQAFSETMLEEEILSTFRIEQIETSRDSVRNILSGKVPKDEAERRISGMTQGFAFIADRENRICAESFRRLYEIAVNPYLRWKEDRLAAEQMYRDGDVKVVNKLQERKIHTGIAPGKIEEKMEGLFSFIENEHKINDLEKAAAIHFYIGYIHPYFDGNGRMARLTHLWFLLQRGYSATLFLPFSSLILQTKAQYNKAYELVEENEKISGMLDITPFLAYFNEHVYRHIGRQKMESDVLERFDRLLEQGKITEKEKQLFHFVLSRYGRDEFSTKQLERDFGNCAYATIRTFVLKLTEFGLLTVHPYGTRRKYCIAPPQRAVTGE